MEQGRSKNPYDDMDEYSENAEKQWLQALRQAPGADMTKRHTDVFKPKNIREFAKHMDARERAKNISNLCLGEFHTACEEYLKTGKVPPIKSSFNEKAESVNEWLKYR